MSHLLFIHHLLKPEHTIRKLLVYMLRHFRIIGIGVVTVIKFHNMKTAAIDIEMDIPLFKIRSDCLPDLHLRVQLFHLAPCGITNTLAVNEGRNKEYLKISPLTFDLQYHAADILIVTHDSVSLAAINRPLYRITGNYLPILLKMIVTPPEFLKRTVIERLLIIKDKLFSVEIFQFFKLYFRHHYSSLLYCLQAPARIFFCQCHPHSL